MVYIKVIPPCFINTDFFYYFLFHIYLALNNTIGVNKPNQSISFDKPDYTNIEGGRGVFGSRYTAVITFPGLSDKSIEELFLGSYTTDFKFCTDDTAPALAPYFCPWLAIS